MSTDRVGNRPFKPALASGQTVRTPLTPRIAGNGTTTPSARSTVPKTPGRTPLVSPKANLQEVQSLKDSIGNSNVTPRSSSRRSRTESAQSSPSQQSRPNEKRPRSTPQEPLSVPSERLGSSGGLGISSGLQTIAPGSRPRSFISDGTSGRSQPTLVKSTRPLSISRPSNDEANDGRFFHASDVQKQEPTPKTVEPKRAPVFFYADGREDSTKLPNDSFARAPSPVRSAASEKRSSGTWTKADVTSSFSKSPPVLSPSSTSATAPSPFFTAFGSPQLFTRSPSPSKENIHLSYRKGVSQIIGTRPSPRPTPTSKARVPTSTTATPIAAEGRPGLVHMQSESPSVSSIDSSNSRRVHRRSASAADSFASPSPPMQESRPFLASRATNPPAAMPSIDTLSSTNRAISSPDPTLSPVKTGFELASDARRERKVLDLEISNSSLLAINTTLERELRRQKAELKRFRRLSRAGRFTIAPNERSARHSDSLSTLGEESEEDEEDNSASFGPPSGLTDVYDESSESEEESSQGSGGELSSLGMKHQDRLAKDEKRLQVDFAKHKELLTRSQMMNQSLRRCMYATEDMINEGKKALQYHVRVSDVKLGGRILTGHEDEDEQNDIEVVEDTEPIGTDEGINKTKGFLDIWQGVGRTTEEYSGDRDSGIEVENPHLPVSADVQRSLDLVDSLNGDHSA